MKRILNSDWFFYLGYLIIALIVVWFLTKLWIPEGFIIAGHDSGLALNTEEFLRTRFFAWDDRIGFGSDNSPHFGSIIMHFFDYLISIFAGVSYAGSQLAVFLWMSGIFIFSFIFSYSLREKFGRYFVTLFPIFITFNFFILQSVFILERAKYELIFSTMIFLTLLLKILFNEKPNVLKYSIIFTFVITIFNGGGWFGLPLYGGLFVIAFTAFMFITALAVKEKSFLSDKTNKLKEILAFYLLNTIFFVFLNAYSIFPYFVTLINSDFAKVVSLSTISAGNEWLNYISRGSSFLNLFRLEGIPDWYLTGYGANPDHSYAGFYLTNVRLVFVSFIFPIIILVGLLIPTKDRTKKYIISFFITLLLVAMFFVSGTNSPLGFIYEFFYTKIPGFNIFRSPYYKFTPAYLIAFSFLLSYSFSKIISVIRLNNFIKLTLTLLIVFGWFGYFGVMFQGEKIFTWQPNKSTLVQVPNYVKEFGDWLNTKVLNGRILIVPAFDKTWRDDSYEWGYWSLSPLHSLLSEKANFVANDLNVTSGEERWINELYSTLLSGNRVNFIELANRLNIKYIFLKEDYLTTANFISTDWLLKAGGFTLVEKFDKWSLYSINDVDDENTFKLTKNIFSVPKEQQYLETQIYDEPYNKATWIDIKYASEDLRKILKKSIYPLNCESCQIENLGKYATVPVVRILPNSPFYQIKQQRNYNSIVEAKDDSAKIGSYLGLIMIKFSEVRSMNELNIEKKFIDIGLKDISFYLQSINDIITKFPVDMTSFYLASKVYETLNPLQRFFRDYITSPDYYYERSFAKEDILKILWQSASLKALFNPLTEQEDRWNYEKYYNLSLLPKLSYSLLIDQETLPTDLNGNKIKPDKIVLTDSNKEFKLEQSDSSRFLITDTKSIIDDNGIGLYFSGLPDLFKVNDGKVLDFPEGNRGCLTGEINKFDKNHSYKFRILSTKDIDNLRLYIKDGNRKIQDNGFMSGDIEVDITVGSDLKSFEYIYVPSANSISPQIFLCRSNLSIPQTARIEVREIFSPIIYAVSDVSSTSNNTETPDFKKVNATEYKIKIDKTDNDLVLIFNSRYSGLWELYNLDTKSFIDDHFVVDGYANGWLIKKGSEKNLTLVYKPQIWYQRGKVVSLVSMITILILFKIKKKYD